MQVEKQKNYIDKHEAKKDYILGMRSFLTDVDIMKKDGSAELNPQYFKVPKGVFWSERQQTLLEERIVEFGPAEIEKIRHGELNHWKSAEIRLRVSKLLKIYDLSVYKNKKFDSMEEIRAEAELNMQRGIENKKLKHKVFYNE